MYKIAIDMMGGDYAPFEIVKAIKEISKNNDDIFFNLYGDETILKEELGDNLKNIQIIHCSQIIEMDDKPILAISKKKDSSMLKAIKSVKEGVSDCCISAGNSGAYMAGAMAYIKRKEGVKRVPFAPIIPTINGPAVIVDAGANVDSKAEHLESYAILGSEFIESSYDIKPKVALLNIGMEESKGNTLTKEAFKLLTENPNINFIGNIEPRDILETKANVLVCDGFVGNVVIKLMEGMFKLFMNKVKKGLMYNIKSKIGALLVKDGIKKAFSDMSMSDYGAAPLLGLQGTILKCHGNSKSKEFINAIYQARKILKED